MTELQTPILCYVTHRAGFAGDEPARAAALLEHVRAAVAAGVDWIQIREKDMATRPLLSLVERAVELARGSATRIVVNDRLDVALAAGAAGAHLGGESIPVGDAIAWLTSPKAAGGHGFSRAVHLQPGTRASVPEEEILVGASSHSLADAQAAERDGASYVFFGPVFATPEKLKYGAPQGIERLAEVCRKMKIPVIAIGGVTPKTAAECLRVGAAGVAAIRMFQEAADLDAMVRTLRQTPPPTK